MGDEEFNRRRSKSAMRKLYDSMNDGDIQDIYIKVCGLCINKTRNEMIEELVNFEGEFPEELFMEDNNEESLEDRMWPVHHIFNGQKLRFIGDELVGLYDLGAKSEDDCDMVIVHGVLSMANPVEMGEIINDAFSKVSPGGRVVLIENIIQSKTIAKSFIRQLEVAGFDSVKFITQVDVWGIITGIKPGGVEREEISTDPISTPEPSPEPEPVESTPLLMDSLEDNNEEVVGIVVEESQPEPEPESPPPDKKTPKKKPRKKRASKKTPI